MTSKIKITITVTALRVVGGVAQRNHQGAELPRRGRNLLPLVVWLHMTEFSH